MAKSEDHLEYAPRTFAGAEGLQTRRALREQSGRTFDRMSEEAETLTPSDAVRLAQRLLVHVNAYGIDYADFQSAQAVERYVRKAINALNGLSLS